MILRDLIKYLELFAPLAWQEEWDNAGLQVGNLEREIKTIVLALDADFRALEYCVEVGADLLITHHPMIFSPIYSINSDNAKEDLILKFIENKISVYSMHTNIDKVPWGTNYALAEELGLEKSILEEPLFPEFNKEFKDISSEFKEQFKQKISGFVSIIEIESSRRELIDRIREVFRVEPELNFEEDARVGTIGLSGGSFDREWLEKAAQAGIDTLIVGEMKYHDKVDARELGIATIALGHDVSENPVLSIFDYLCKSYNSYAKSQGEEESGSITEFDILHFPRIEYDKFN